MTDTSLTVAVFPWRFRRRLDRRDLAETADREDPHQEGVDDEVQTVDFVGMLEKRIDACAVQILDRAHIDGNRPAAALAGSGQGFAEHVDVAVIDLASRNHPGRPVDATVGVKGEWSGHYVILAYI